MTQRDNILQELKELNSRLAAETVPNVYTVPAGYFDGLANLVISRIKAMEANNAADELNALSPQLGNLSRKIPYILPNVYFVILPVNVF